jgi:hypothetical protein
MPGLVLSVLLSSPSRLRRLRLPNTPWSPYYSPSRGRLASTGLLQEWQRAQVQNPGKTLWNVLTANSNLALAA